MRKPKAYERADCDYCGGLITYHEDDPRNPWKHFYPTDSLRCAEIRPQGEASVPAKGVDT